MSEVAHWLERRGLGHYAQLFEHRNIRFENLVVLTDQELKEIGVPSGPRQAILREIELLSPSTRVSDRAASVLPAPMAERRQLTLLFCDLV